MNTSTLRRLTRGLLVVALALVPLIGSAIPAQAASEASFGVVNACGSLYVRPTLVAVFQQHTGCGTVRDTAISPDGHYIAVINTDGSLAIKDGPWGQWQTHVGPNDAKKVSLGPHGMVGIINGCGATMIKTTIFGAWQQHTSCGSAVDLAISPEGRYVAVIDTDRSLAIKDGLWGAWQTHLGAGDANDVTFGPNGMVGVVNGCHAMYIKTSITGAWNQHLGCNGARSVAISPDGQVIGAITADGSSFAKQGLWGAWVNQTQTGDTQALTVGVPLTAATPPTTTTATKAGQILALAASRRIAIADYSEGRARDAADRSLASQQLQDLAGGLRAKLSTRCSYASSYAKSTPTATVAADDKVLAFLVELGNTSPYTINTLFGQCHSGASSSHHLGQAVDFSCRVNIAEANRIGLKYGIKKNFETCSANGHWHYSINVR